MLSLLSCPAGLLENERIDKNNYGGKYLLSKEKKNKLKIIVIYPLTNSLLCVIFKYKEYI
jgi:hypothetical protein